MRREWQLDDFDEEDDNFFEKEILELDDKHGYIDPYRKKLLRKVLHSDHTFEQDMKGKRVKLDGYEDMEEKGLFPLRPADRIGEIINRRTWKRRLRKDETNLDRGPETSSHDHILSMIEFHNYYNRDVNDGLCSLYGGIIQAIASVNHHKPVHFAYVIQNEMIFKLIKRHGVRYDAAVDLVEIAVCLDGVRNFIDLDQTIANIKCSFEETASKAICDILYEAITRAYKICDQLNLDIRRDVFKIP